MPQKGRTVRALAASTWQATFASGAAVLLTACAPGEAQSTPDDRAPPARIAGEAQSCIPIAQIRSSTVRSDYTIDFEASGGTTYRNTLPSRCPGLGRERAFSYSTSLSQLCDKDIITVITTGGGGIQPLASCGLGMFQPVELIDE